MNEYKLFAQRIGLVGLVNVLSSLSGIILLPVISKRVPLADYGTWAQVNVTIGLVSLFMMMGLAGSLTRFLAASKERQEIRDCFFSMFAMVLAASTILSLLMFWFSKYIAYSLFDNNIAIAEILPLIIFVQSVNGFVFSYFRAVQQMTRFSLLTLASIYLDVVLISFMVLTNHGIYGAVQALLATRVVLLCVMLFLIIRQIGVGLPRFKNARDYLAYGLPIVPSSLSSWVINSSNRYVINIFLGTAAVGLYSPGYLLGNLIVTFVDPISFVLTPALSKCYDDNQECVVKTMLSRSIKYYMAIAIPSAFGLSILSKPILSVMSTPQIADQGHLITPFVAVSMLFYGAFSIASNVIALKKRTIILAYVWVIGGALNLGLTVALVRYSGILGAAAATLVTFIFVFLIASYISYSYMRFEIDYRFILKSVFSSMIMSLVLLLKFPSSLLEIFVLVIVGAGVYFAVLFLIRGVDEKEVAFFREAFLRRR